MTGRGLAQREGRLRQSAFSCALPMPVRGRLACLRKPKGCEFGPIASRANAPAVLKRPAPDTTPTPPLSMIEIAWLFALRTGREKAALSSG